MSPLESALRPPLLDDSTQPLYVSPLQPGTPAPSPSQPQIELEPYASRPSLWQRYRRASRPKQVAGGCATLLALCFVLWCSGGRSRLLLGDGQETQLHLEANDAVQCLVQARRRDAAGLHRLRHSRDGGRQPVLLDRRLDQIVAR